MRAGSRSPRPAPGIVVTAPSAISPGGMEGKDRFMTSSSVTCVRGVYVLLLAAAGAGGCGSIADEGATATIQSAVTAAAADPVPCAAWADAIVGNTGGVVVGARTLVDSYQSSLGAYGGTNVGS